MFIFLHSWWKDRRSTSLTVHWLAALILVLVSANASAQHIISGVVRDARTDEVLVNASVQLVDERRLTITDASGRFTFDNVPAGTATVGVSYMGYEAMEKSVRVPGDANIIFKLQPTAILTDAVVVRATRATGKTPTTFTNLEQKEIREHNFGQDVPFLLNWTPSVVTTSDAGTGIGYTG